jgi:large subunit ribosomal protein L10
VPATRAAKEAEVNSLRDRFERSVAAVFVDFRGLDVEAATNLRNEFRKVGVEYKVVKNTLVKLALRGTPLGDDGELTKLLVGPTGIAWSYEDPSAAAKVVKAFRKDDVAAKKLQAKFAVMEKQVMAGARVETDLANMPGKNEVRAMLLAQLLAPAQSLVRQLTAPGQNLAFAFDARKRQLEEG